MQYHAHSLAETQDVHVLVDLIGYKGTRARPEIESHPNITQHLLWAFPKLPFYRLFFLFYAPLKLLLLAVQLLWILFFGIQKPDVILVQNPPAIPALLVAFLACKIRSAKLVIDWHNFGYSILALNMGPRHKVVKMYKWYEHFFGKLADANFCVSAAMQRELYQNWGICATVLYDRPPSFFRKRSIGEAHELFVELQSEFRECAADLGERLSPSNTFFAVRKDKGKEKEGTPKQYTYLPKQQRPAFIISSTSWTPDEDFGVLLEAIDTYEGWLDQSNEDFPPLIFIITGKGPMKDYYKQLIRERQYRHTHVLTMWLSAENYPKLLGCCDLGISLHTSSSGLDLPMKVVDMFGCELPVLAYHFKCLHELVQHKRNGLHFNNSLQLAKQLYKIFKEWPYNKQRLQSITASEPLRWDESWRETAWPKVIHPLLKGRPIPPIEVMYNDDKSSSF
ncbi:mannosyltransferase [Balamuthia mandrillaris]